MSFISQVKSNRRIANVTALIITDSFFFLLFFFSPGNQTPVSLISTGSLTTTLHHSLNSPRPDVSVLVLSTTSRSPLPITQYVMQAVVPRACKVRLLAPSSTEMPQYSPFLPPPAITQIMLLANPNEVRIILHNF